MRADSSPCARHIVPRVTLTQLRLGALRKLRGGMLRSGNPNCCIALACLARQHGDSRE
jgi:hypothetical protein